MRLTSPGGRPPRRVTHPGWRLLSAAAACLAVALTAAAAAPRPGNMRPGNVQHPSGAIGGPQLAGTGVIVNYPASAAKPLLKIKASAWVVADADTGQVLAAITLMPVLSPNATVVAT